MRPQEPRSFAAEKEIRLEDPEETRFWTEHLNASAEEIAAAIDKVGANRTAVELYLGVVSDRPSAGPSESAGPDNTGRSPVR